MALVKTEKQASKDALFYYFVVKNEGKIAGPFSHDEILQMIAEKQISYRAYCWRSGFREWRPIIATEDFRVDFRGDALQDPVFPGVEIPNEIERYSHSSRVHGLPRPKDRRVIVSFAKTKVKRVSVYEWCFALLFAIGLSFFTTQWSLKELVTMVEQRTEEMLVGVPQEIGSFHSESPHAEYMLSPLLSAPGIQQYDQAPVALEAMGVALSKETMRSEWGALIPLANVEHEELWDAREHALPEVYQKPLYVRGHVDFSSNPMRLLVSHPGAPIRSP